MKIQKYITTGILAAGALLLAGSARIQAQVQVGTATEKVLTIQTFDTAAAGTGVEWGTSTVAWDGTHGNTDGSLLVTATLSGGSDTPMADYVCNAGGNPWYTPGGSAIQFSSYTNISFDILYDTTSDITIAQFNDLSTWPANLTNSAGQTVLQNWGIDGTYLSGSTGGIDIEYCGANNQMAPSPGAVNIPAGAGTAWQHVNVPIIQSQPGIDGQNGIVFHKWINQCWGIANPAVARFWIDNVQIEGKQAPPPPPTMSPVMKAIPGLNIFNASAGLYDRHEVIATATSGLTWVGNTPTTYAFDMTGFPANSIYSTEAYMFLVPNAGYEDNAADWNEPNVMILELQATPNGGGQALLSYKTNSPSTGNPPYDMAVTFNGTTNTSVQSTLLLGNYSITFTGNDAGYVQVPDGTQGSFTLGGTDGEKWFTETGLSNYNFLIYLGGQMNSTTAANQPVVYSSFTLTQNGNVNAISENFVADATNATPALVNWSTGPSSSPAGDVLVPSSALYWVDWSLPAPGYSLLDSPSLTPPNWAPVSTYTPISMDGDVLQLIDPSDLQGPTTDQFFAAVQRVYATSSNYVGSLEIAFPGQTFVNGVGVTGTPTPITDLFGAWTPGYVSGAYTSSVTNVFGSKKTVQTPGDVYVYAVDVNHYLVSVNDGITLYSSPANGVGFDQTDGDFIFIGNLTGALGVNMVGGIATFNDATNSSQFEWGYAGAANSDVPPPSPGPAPYSFMVQAVDYTQQAALGNANVPTFNSTPVQLNP